MRYWIIAAIGGSLLIANGCGRKSAATDQTTLKLFAPIPEAVSARFGGNLGERIALGRMLYYDVRLSRNQKIACNTCHDLSNYGVDGQPTSEGHKGQHGDRNAPTVYNAAAHFAQFWDGRASDVEEQAKGPVLNPIEMAMPSDKAVLDVLRSMPGYVAAFRRAYPDDRDPLTYDNVADAIGAFERRLMTPARWDRFLRGDQAALTEEEKAGFSTFISTGCQACHQGALMGGNLYQKIGAAKPYPDSSDPGRYKLTRSESDRMTFKVPSLRNIEKTAPYFHNGKVRTLEQAVAQMGEYQLGKQLKDEQVASIVTFLKTLTGTIPAEYIQQPELPKSTAKTPKPQESD